MKRHNSRFLLLVLISAIGCSKAEQTNEQLAVAERDALPITALATSTEENPIHNTAHLLSVSVGDEQFEDLVFCSEAHEAIREPGPKGNPKTVTYTGLNYADKDSMDVARSMKDDDVSTGFSSQFLHSTLNLFFETELVDSNGTRPNVFLVEVGGDDRLRVQAIVGGTIQHPELDGSIVDLEASDWGPTGHDLSGVTNGGFMFTKKLCGIGIDIGAFNLPKGKDLKGVQIIQENTEEADLVLVAGSN